jgi:hypothetical protein
MICLGLGWRGEFWPKGQEISELSAQDELGLQGTVEIKE